MNSAKLKPLLLILMAQLVTSFCAYGGPDLPNGGDDKFVVVLDAGHGGHDPGNLGNGYFEKNIALNIVLNIGKILENDPDIKVIYTRDDDTFVDLYVRGEIANKANADLFVSVHCDSHSSNAHGAGTFVLGLHANKQNFDIAKKENSVIYLEDNYEKRYADYDINSPESVIGLTIMQEEFLDQSIRLAKGIQDNFSGQLKRNDRKVKQAGFIVLHQTFMPSVLVETGFLTNADEGAYLNSKKGQEEMGNAIANAILKYKNGVPVGTEKATNTTLPSDVDKAPDTDEKPEMVEELPETVTVPDTAVADEAVEVSEASPQATEVKEEIPPAVETEVIEVTKTDTDGVAAPSADVPERETPKAVAEKVLTETVAEPESTPTEPITEVAPAEKKEKANITFKVQLLASSKDIALRSDNFNGLNKLSREPFKNMFRYLYGSTTSFEEAKLLKSNADIKGYPTSYIVAYKDGKRITMAEAQKYVSD
ncbi:N-acetylmuramoyl-L-alanine amidase [Maribacter sp. 2-571]|uniref:N-acetylmuramoyl-L-alanine amidase family protein n=1 Tax=Maribacter sp. 2-571 TaxID=3417569 RepID=UPI003D34E269